MTIHFIGDSHPFTLFSEQKDIVVHHLGAITMKRVGHPDDDLIETNLNFELSKDDIIIFSFGEIDVRAHFQTALDRAKAKNKDEDIIFTEHVDAYISKLVALKPKFNDARVCVMSLIPAARQKKALKKFPFVGTDQQRTENVIKLNALLKQRAIENGIEYFDVHSLYKDKENMLCPLDTRDGMHIHKTTKAIEALKQFANIDEKELAGEKK